MIEILGCLHKQMFYLCPVEQFAFFHFKLWELGKKKKKVLSAPSALFKDVTSAVVTLTVIE